MENEFSALIGRFFMVAKRTPSILPAMGGILLRGGVELLNLAERMLR